jgi:polysaccharide biosynthesis/export protein
MPFAERFPSEIDRLAWKGGIGATDTNLIEVSPQVINILAEWGPLMSGRREPQTFLGIGASGQRREFDLRLSLAEGVSKASSLNGTDPSTVFLYRGETRAVAKRLGIDCARCPGRLIPVIYKVNLDSREGRLLASKFEMRNKDAIYIPDTTSDEIANALTYFEQIESTANDLMLAARRTR